MIAIFRSPAWLAISGSPPRSPLVQFTITQEPPFWKVLAGMVLPNGRGASAVIRDPISEQFIQWRADPRRSKTSTDCYS